ncbi:hypothetical protein NOM68_18470, partial [Proteus mirabilis]|uniref:hypothetical protein n=2 Tax=Proteus mirabilis TaxID=584 RepID=UPI00217EDBC2
IFIAYGLDYTRQTSDKLISYLPEVLSITGASVTTSWLIVSISLILKYVFVSRKKVNLAYRLLIYIFFSLWILLYIIPSNVNELMTNNYFSSSVKWLIRLDIVVSIFLFIILSWKNIKEKLILILDKILTHKSKNQEG